MTLVNEQLDEIGAVLVQTYARLLKKREVMMRGIDEQEQSKYLQRLYVYSLIDGLMTHLEDVAVNQDSYNKRLADCDNNFGTYASRMADELSAVISQSDSRQPPDSGSRNRPSRQR